MNATDVIVDLTTCLVCGDRCSFIALDLDDRERRLAMLEAEHRTLTGHDDFIRSIEFE